MKFALTVVEKVRESEKDLQSLDTQMHTDKEESRARYIHQGYTAQEADRILGITGGKS